MASSAREILADIAFKTSVCSACLAGELVRIGEKAVEENGEANVPESAAGGHAEITNPQPEGVLPETVGLRAWKWTSSKSAGSGNNAALAALIGAVRFAFGKPTGGACLLVNPASILVGNLVKRAGNGSVSNYYRPDDDPRWMIPAIAARLVSTVLIPSITMLASPRGYVIPFGEKWDGSVPVLDLVADPTKKAIYYAYQRSIGDSSIGGYIAREIQLEEPWTTLYEAVKWPTPKEIWASIPVVSFERMLIEDHSYKILSQDAVA